MEKSLHFIGETNKKKIEKLTFELIRCLLIRVIDENELLLSVFTEILIIIKQL